MGKVSMDLAMVAVGSVIVQPHCEKTWERSGLDVSMVAVGSVIVQPYCEKTWERSAWTWQWWRLAVL